MAEYRNITDAELWVPVANQALKPGESFQVDDETARTLLFSDELFETVAGPRPLPEAKAPAKNASTAAWHDFALAKGADPNRIADMSRDDLVAEFGTEED